MARHCGLTTQAVSNIIAELEADGMVLPMGRRKSGLGQPPVQYQFNPNGAFALGFELRPDALLSAEVNFAGDILHTDRLPLDKGTPEEAIPAIAAVKAGALLRMSGSRSRFLGAGVVMPGPFGVEGLSQAGTTVLPGWADIDIEKTLIGPVAGPVVVENDATAAAVAERVRGVARDLNSFCFIYFGTGLGLGLVLDGQVYRGALGNAGEIGHIVVEQDGNCCACGNRGCLETYASRQAARMHMNKFDKDIPDGDSMAGLLAGNDPDFSDWLDIAAGRLSQTVGLLENLFDPEMVIFGGAMPDVVLDELISRLQHLPGSVARHANRTTPRVMRGASGRMTAALGAAALLIHQQVAPGLEIVKSQSEIA
jgi:predicted NBD/HSP70 family sugar kinase